MDDIKLIILSDEALADHVRVMHHKEQLVSTDPTWFSRDAEEASRLRELLGYIKYLHQQLADYAANSHAAAQLAGKLYDLLRDHKEQLLAHKLGNDRPYADFHKHCPHCQGLYVITALKPWLQEVRNIPDDLTIATVECPFCYKNIPLTRFDLKDDVPINKTTKEVINDIMHQAIDIPDPESD